MFLRNKARPHTAVSVKQFSAEQGTPELNQPPPPPDGFVFPEIRLTQLRGRTCEDTEGVTCKRVREVFPPFYEEHDSV
jgi:hypothetical protein